MKHTLRTRKGIILLSQVVAVLVIVAVLLIVQIGAFAGPGKEEFKSNSEPTDVAPTLLVASKTPDAPAQVVESSQPPMGDVAQSGNGVTPAQKACEDQMKSSADAANAVLRQAWQLWDQLIALQNAAAASLDPVEAANLYAQADALMAEHQRLNDLGIQMDRDRFGGHSGMGCNSNGVYYFD